ncbi:MAG: HAD family hydrolase [Melioribacteraceae bacterium]|nr:HAD family hydrolase [Melioribacteraceae bacterium]
MYNAVFLDRDGTINLDTNYVKNPDDVIILPHVPEGIRKLKELFGFKIVVISNQAGVAKGLMTLNDVHLVNEKIQLLLKEYNTEIDAFYFCPFHPDYDDEEKSKCRKPSPFMILKASKELNINLNKSYMIGDRSSDIEAGFNAGVKSILLSSEIIDKELEQLKKKNIFPSYIANNFLEACEFIIKDFGGNN